MMRKVPSIVPALVAALLVSIAATGCRNAPGYPKAGPEVPRPEDVQDFATLYQSNCAGCHGEHGSNGAAIDLANPVYLALAGRERLLQVTTQGVPHTLMPGFATPAGMLTDRQVQSIVDGMLSAWGKREILAGAHPPPYAATFSAGDPKQGLQAFGAFCARCHGPNGEGAANAANVAGISPVRGSIVDPSYLQLVSDQYLRTLILAGRADQGMPDWRSNTPANPPGSPPRTQPGIQMTDKQVTDILAWLASQRPASPAPPTHAAGGKD